MKLRVGRRLSFAALIAVCALALAACGEKKDALSAPSGSDQPLSLMLDWVPNADHVGIYQALREGDFTKAGLNVHVEIPSDPATPLNLVAAGKVDIAISYEPELLRFFQARFDLVPAPAELGAVGEEGRARTASVG